MKITTAVEAQVGSQILHIETGLLARLAHGAATVQLGETIVFSAVTATEKPRSGIDFFPMQVEYREKFYAAGAFPGGFFKREARPSEKEILTARLTDRPIRPLFQTGYHHDVQINNMLLSADGENDSDILSIVASSTALTLSDLPFHGPIAAVRIGRVNGDIVLNPTNSERGQSDLDLIYVGNRESMVMIEGEADEISEADLLTAIRAAHAACLPLIDAQLELRRKLGLPDKVVTDLEPDANRLALARELAGTELSEALLVPEKKARNARLAQVRENLLSAMRERTPELTDEQFRETMDLLVVETTRRNVLENNRRIDGRGMHDLRTLQGDVGLIPRTHGSSLFARGETQALGIVTLGSKSDSQSMDSITGGPDEKTFMFHYNFPPYSVGEVGRLGSTGRREIGHGALAERSLEKVMPKDYPYTVRLVSEVMGSNGSTSMASVCAGTLALMDAGVPITRPVAGISIGLFTDPQRTQMVTDILGDEDHCGDMDFKVAGTSQGITGFQVDLKIRGLSFDLIEQALKMAHTARLQILEFMGSILAQPRPEMCAHAPRIQVIKIDPEKIGALIGPGGKNIRRITEVTGAKIDIEEDGSVHIFSADGNAMEMAVREVNLITAEAEEGAIYDGVVSGVKEFGAFVEILPGKDGLVHISELADFRVNKVEDICKPGDQMWVKCIGIDERGRVRLSRRAAMQEKGLTEPASS
ncbi:MAG: polyribonucleotide nucleotidyltransferase [Lentisphaerae bacterium]|nr:polyribonucleotide nucleotidyltransferase [Lentisphaerota bacterium]